MAVLPTFDGGTQADDNFAGNAVSAGIDQGQSIMDRVQTRQLRADQDAREQAQADRQQQIYDITKPILQAKSQADLLTAQATLTNAKHLQDLRAQAAAIAPQAQQEFVEANQLADFDSKANALAELQAKYSWMNLVPEYKPFVDVLNHSRVDAHASAIADAKLEEELEVSRTAADARKYASDNSGATREDVANINAGARTDAAQIAGDARQASAATTAAGRFKVATLAAKRQYELETTIEKRDEALKSGDNEDAQIYQDHINKMNSSSTASPDRPLPAAKPAAPAPVEASPSSTITLPQSLGGPDRSAEAAPTPSPVVKIASAKPPSKINIEGTDYPVFKDKAGNLAYLKDGKYVDIVAPDASK